jgi:hypothetical protein
MQIEDSAGNCFCVIYTRARDHGWDAAGALVEYMYIYISTWTAIRVTRRNYVPAHCGRA